MSVNKYNGTDLIKIAGKGQKGDLIEDTKDCMTTFTSSDDSTESGLILPSGGDITVPQIVSGDTHSNLFSGLSKIALNTRKLINTAKRIWNSVGATWVSGHAYAVNDMVVYENGHVYKCKAAHTSSASILPTNTSYWTDTTLAAEICSLNNRYASLFKIEEISTWANNNKLKTALFAIAIAQLTGTGSITTVFMANKSSYNLSSGQYNGINVLSGDVNGEYRLLYIIWNSSTGTLTAGNDTLIKKVWVITLNS